MWENLGFVGGISVWPCPLQPVIESIISQRPWKTVLSVCICLCPLLVIGLLFLGFITTNFDHESFCGLPHDKSFISEF